MQHGVGLRLKMELAELRQRHRLPPPVPHIEESLPETEDAPCTLSGYASTYDVDLERMKFRKYSLLWSPYKLPPLYYRHQPLVIGTVVELQDTDAGVGVSVITDHPPAMCCGLSVSPLLFMPITLSRPILCSFTRWSSVRPSTRSALLIDRRTPGRWYMIAFRPGRRVMRQTNCCSRVSGLCNSSSSCM
jgi:hypothetical protein